MHTNVPIDSDAIILVAFGSATERGLDVYRKLEQMIVERYPEVPVLWAFTSESIPSDHKKIFTIAEVVEYLDKNGFTRAIFLPLYVVPGSAYEKLETDLDELFSRPLLNLREYVLAAPLLHEARDADIVSQALLDSLPNEDDAPERILFMGHGSSTEAGNAAYEDVDDLLDRTWPGTRLALLQGDSFETLLAEWGDADEGERVLLRPFFFTIGQHSFHDLQGNDPQSWKNRLEAIGYTTEVELISLGDLPLIRELLMEHLDEAYTELDSLQ